MTAAIAMTALSACFFNWVGCSSVQRIAADEADSRAAPDGAALDRGHTRHDARHDGELPPSDAGSDAAALPMFDRIKLGEGAGPCPKDGDCYGFIELFSSGKLRVDRFGEIPVTVHEATITEHDVKKAVAVFTVPALHTLLAAEQPPCAPVADVSETIELQLANLPLVRNYTTFCEQSALVAARDMLHALAEDYLPVRRECSCEDECPENQRCLQSQAGGLTPSGVECDTPRGIAECRPSCRPNGYGTDDCPPARPYCITVSLSAGCCSDASERVGVCCANADASDNTNCL